MLNDYQPRDLYAIHYRENGMERVYYMDAKSTDECLNEVKSWERFGRNVVFVACRALASSKWTYEK